MSYYYTQMERIIGVSLCCL